MQYTSPDFDVNLDPDGFVIDFGSLYACLCTLSDRRDARGVRYALVTVLVCIVLAKLAGEDRLAGIAEWVKHRQAMLAEVLHWRTVRAPHRTTYSRILGQVIAIEELEHVVREFFASQSQASSGLQIVLDGKTLRGTIAAGQTHGLHLLAAFVPDEGWVVMQVAVDHKENEIVAACAEKPGFTGQNRDGRCPSGATRPVRADRDGRGRLRLDGQGQPGPIAPRHCQRV
jgi:hypothetical protein